MVRARSFLLAGAVMLAVPCAGMAAMQPASPEGEPPAEGVDVEEVAGEEAVAVPAEPEAASPEADIDLAAATEEEGEPLAAQEAGEAPQYALYEPQDELERGLWLRVGEAERDLQESQLVIRDEALNAYMRGLLCKLAGEAECANIRLYIMHNPNFNATMAPNGAMQVWSGLLLRTQNEAQLATVLAHEYAHFKRRHSVQLFRRARNRSNAASWLAFTGIGLIGSIMLIDSIFSYSRDMETEADLDALAMLDAAGYDTREAAAIWEQLRAEMDATAEARGEESRKDKNGGLFATHPPTADRVEYLTQAAQDAPGVPEVTGYDSYQQAMADWLPVFLDDQLKMSDYGGNAFLLESIAAGGVSSAWLDYAWGENFRRQGDEDNFAKAVEHYDAALAKGGTLPQIWRGRGLSLMRLGRTEEGRADLAEYLARAPDAPDRGMISMISGGN